MAEKVLRSRINDIIRNEDMAWELVELNRSSMRHGSKANAFYKILDKYNVAFEPLGLGTNRVGIKINGFCYKYSLNKEGLFDTRREMYLSKNLGRDVVMVHEVTSDGTMGVYEYVRTISTEQELRMYYEKIQAMMQRITSKYFVGDMGIVAKNSRNIGVRSDGSVCSIDFAYIKSIRSKDVTCPRCHAVYQYAPDFASVYCNCRTGIKFEELRRYFTDDSSELAKIPHQSYEFNGEKSKTVALDPMKSIIEHTKQDEDEAIKREIQQRKEEDRYKAIEMIKQHHFDLNKYKQNHEGD